MYSLIRPNPGLGVERTATSPSLNVHLLDSFAGRTITSYHPKPPKVTPQLVQRNKDKKPQVLLVLKLKQIWEYKISNGTSFPPFNAPYTNHCMSITCNTFS